MMVIMIKKMKCKRRMSITKNYIKLLIRMKIRNTIILVIFIMYLLNTYSTCPNNCSGHGKCFNGSCDCFGSVGTGENKMSYSGNDCSLMLCGEGSSFSYVSEKEDLKNEKKKERELNDEIIKRNRGLSSEMMMIVKESIFLDENEIIYKVELSDKIISSFKMIGGIIECENKKEIEILLINKENKEGYIKINSDEKEINIGSTLICERIKSKQNSMIYINSNTEIEDKNEKRILVWKYYGRILKELEILNKENINSNKYIKDDFKFACYNKPTKASDILDKEIKVYENVKGEYEEKEENTNGELIFTFEGEEVNKPDAKDLCYCLMNGDIKPTQIENTELYYHLLKDDETYRFGKYNKGGFDDFGYNVYKIINPVDINTPATRININLLYRQNYINHRIVYVDVYDKGKISEESGTVVVNDKKTVTISLNNGIKSGILLPYIKFHSLNPLIDQIPSIDFSDSSSPIYKIYNVYDLSFKLILYKGWILQCSYIKDNEMIDISIDIKLYKMYYVYVEFSDENAIYNIDTVKCYGVSHKRGMGDLTMFNPLKLDKDNYNIGEYKLTWKGYGIIPTTIPSASSLYFACYTPDKNDNIFTKYNIEEIKVISNDRIFTISKKDGNYPNIGDICYLFTKYNDLSKTDLGQFIRKEDGNYYYGKYPIPNEGIDVILDDNSLPIFVFDNKINKIEKSKIIINENDINNEDLEYFVVGNIILIEIIGINQPMQYNYQTIITSINSKTSKIEIYFTPSIPINYKSTGILHIQSLSSLVEIVDVADDNKHLYKVNDIYGNLLIKLPLLGGKLQCEYKKEEKKEMGIVDIKSNVIRGGSYNNYIQFDYKIDDNIKDIECNEILSKRNDLTLLNPTKIDNRNYDRNNHKLTWKGYGNIFKDIGFDIISYTNVKFACYTPKDGNEEIRIYKDIIIKIKELDILFSFSSENEPSDGDICYLLCKSNGDEIEIESSDLFELIRKEEDGKYYFGKYGNIKEINKINKNEDGSIIQIIGTNYINNNEKDSDFDDEKIYIGKLSDLGNPSISYSLYLINEEIMRMMIIGTRIKIKYNNNQIESQILKIITKSNQKFELILNKGIEIRNNRILNNNNNRLLDDGMLYSLEIIFENEKSIHKRLECSGQGICNRENGLCECFVGFSGSNCERLDCPSNCNGNGRCVSLSDLLSNAELNNNYNGFGNKHEIKSGNKKVLFENQVYGCLCDKRHRGYDCSLIECPSGEDPEGVSNNDELEYRDCSGRGICDYLNGICKCFDGFIGEGCEMMVEMM